jgi:hypothetical protein
LVSEGCNTGSRQIDRRRADLPQRADGDLFQPAERAALGVSRVADAAHVVGDALQHAAGSVHCAQFDDDIAHRRFR